MTDELTPATAVEQGETSGEQPDAEPAPQTVEEVEALWKNRVSQKDKAHAAAEKVLREQVETLQKQLGATPNTGSSAETPSDDAGKAAQAEAQKRIEALQQQVEEQRVANLRLRYPALAEQVGADTSIFAHTDEATLAKLNAMGVQVQPPSNPIVDHSTPKRGAPAAPSKEPTSDELKGRLAQEEAAWKESLGMG